MVIRHILPCCALAQMTCSDFDSLEDIQREIDRMKREAKHYWYEVESGHGYGQKAVFVITTPNERYLEKNLKKLGFKSLTKFNRRTGYPAGQLTMWFLNWD